VIESGERRGWREGGEALEAPAEGETPPPLDDAVYRAHALFRYTLRRFLRFSEQQARGAGITPEQHQLLLAVRGTPEGWLSVGDVARQLMVQPHSALGLVERAAQHGLVTREDDPADGRRVRVRLTPLGEDLIARLTAEHRAEMARLWRQIKPLM
jgi:DNA-binding MarR family transcriptional regulator